jgi:hypothetical protein
MEGWCVNQGDLLANRDGVQVGIKCSRARRTGVRAHIVARNSLNGEGAKGGRKVERFWIRRSKGKSDNRRECRKGLSKPEKSAPDGGGWKRESGRNGC